MPINLPDFPSISAETLLAMSERQGFALHSWECLPQVGIFNAVYILNHDLILRVPRQHRAFTSAIEKEAIVIPLARIAGVRTPQLIAFDNTLEQLPVPYLITERVHGLTLGLLNREPEETPLVWQELGRDLALLHTSIQHDGPVAHLQREVLPDPRPLPEKLAEAGYITALETRWLNQWLERLAPAALAPVTERLLHGDIQSTNVMVANDSLDYLALIDWGSTGWGDPAHDFAGIPLRAVPLMLTGYRQIAPLDNDDTAEARILWRHLQIALWLVGRGPQPGLSWGERPLSMLLEIMHFLLHAPQGRWRELVL